MRVYYYHTVDVGTMYKGWKEGIFPGHLLYGATHLPCHGIDVMFHQPTKVETDITHSMEDSDMP